MSQSRRARREDQRAQAQQRLRRELAARRHPVAPEPWWKFWTSPRKVIGLSIGVLLAAVMAITSYPLANPPTTPSVTPEVPTPVASPTPVMQLARPENTLVATSSYSANVVTGAGTVAFPLNTASAPEAVNSFKYLADQQFYQTATIDVPQPHGYAVLGKRADVAGPGYGIQPEPSQPLQLGSVALLGQADGTLGHQFAIVLDPGVALPQPYTVIGRVTSGLDIVRRWQTGDRITSISVAELQR